MAGHAHVLFLVNTLYFLSTGAVGIIGSAVSAVQDRYHLDNQTYNVLYYGPSGVYLIGMPIWAYLLRRYKWTNLCTIAASMITIGFALQCGCQSSFWWTVTGACTSSIGAVFLLTSSSMIINRWFTVEEKATAYGSLFVFGGLGAFTAFLVARLAITSAARFDALYVGLMIMFGAVSACATVMSFMLEEWPPDGARALVAPDPRYSWLCPPPPPEHVILHIVSYVLVSGPNWTISSLLTEKLTDHNYSDNDIILAWSLFSGAGLIPPMVIGKILGTTHAYRTTVFGVMVIVTAVYIPWALTFNMRTVCLILTTILGLATGANTTMFVETTIELAYPLPAEYWSPLMIYFAQIFNLLCTLLASYDATKTAATWLFAALFGGATVALGVALHYKVQYKRYKSKPIRNSPSSSVSV